MTTPAIEPDTKDWTWVLRRPCPECGVDVAGLDRADLGRLVRDNAVGWTAVLALPEAGERPGAGVWSPLEYACHVRDVHRVFGERLRLMLDEDEPRFPDWDQDEAAVVERYDRQDPAEVAPDLVTVAEAVARTYGSLVGAPEATWGRRGVRSNGSEFTVDSIARYHLHDVLHHAWDVRAAAARATTAAYDGDAVGYSDGTWACTEELAAELDAFATAVGAGGSVLEIGSAGGRDALELEARGLRVRRTDVTPAFVELMRSRGHQADWLDPLVDDLVDDEHGPYDGVWASACLLHVARTDLPVVLVRLAGATRSGGVLAMSLKDGDGDAWSAHGHVRAARRFTYWRATPLRVALEEAGWRVVHLTHDVGADGQAWLVVRGVLDPV